MKRTGTISVIATGVAFICMATLAGASVSEPLHVKTGTDGVVTTRGHFCPSTVGCTVTTWRPDYRPRLHAHPHQRVTVVTNEVADDMHVELWRPKPHRSQVGEAVVRRQPNQVGPKRWRFRLPHHPHPRVDALFISADYAQPEGSADYWAGLRIR
jgi:hypothetical protein